MRIFVAGASGVIGRLLIPLLAKEGHEIFGMTHNKASKGLIQEIGATPVVADVFDRDAVISAFREVRPEIVIHQLTSLSKYNLEDNAKIRNLGTRNLVDASRTVGVKRMIAQSISWAYEPGSYPATEESLLDVKAPEPRKTTIDGVVALENAVSEMEEFVILRFGMLYGPSTWYDPSGMIAEKVRNQEMKATDGIMSFLHIADAARVTLAALEWPNGAVNIVDDEPVPGTVWLPYYASLIGAPEPKVQASSNRGERGASNAKARQEYGWEPIFPTWYDGFRASLSSSNNIKK